MFGLSSELAMRRSMGEKMKNTKSLAALVVTALARNSSNGWIQTSKPWAVCFRKATFQLP